jgi:hypothetical protein
MITTVNTEFKIQSWDEQPFGEAAEERKLTRASITKTYHGDIEGVAILEYLMMYRQDGSASFVGLERINGKLGSRSGSFVLQHIGTFIGGVVNASLTVIPDSGSGELAGMSGAGSFESGHAESYPLTLTIDFKEEIW